MAFQSSGGFGSQPSSQNSYQAVPQHGSAHPDRLSIWRADLESIRRESEVLDSNRYRSQQVIVQPRPSASSNPGNTSVASADQPGPVVIVDDDDDDDNGHGAGNNSAAAVLTFYGQQGQEEATANDMIKYQDQKLARQCKYPSRKNGLGFDMDQLRRDSNWAAPSGAQVDTAWDKDMYMSSPPLGFDDAVSRNWAGDLQYGGLLSGFPLVEDVVFFYPGNYGGARSACFCKAVAYLIYGDNSFNLRVQAEHLQHYGDVLEWEDHPRHHLYKRMNKKFYDTWISTSSSEVSTVANFFQLLSIPNAWMPLDMLDVTADLYNIFIVVYTVAYTNDNRITLTEVSTKGSYNARHVCLLFNGAHYQPMVPNAFLASEFTFPRVTYENVKSLPSSSNVDQGKSSIDLRWRNTWGRGLDRKKGALPINHAFYKQTLKIAMTGAYPRQ